MDKNLLIIVDPQYDFINGSLPVDGSIDKMEKLSVFLKENSDLFHDVIVTLDFHPSNHVSFTEWPKHCIQHSHGASIYNSIIESLISNYNDKFEIYLKGQDKNAEEYSFLSNDKNREKFIGRIIFNQYDNIYICGICGDVCVLNTIIDLNNLKNGERSEINFNLKIICDFTPSLDGGIKLYKLIDELKLDTYNPNLK